ncbi:hypothetical protein M9H77_24460 [Catharanthus roseus]|uniref:Uncharacterized protein n=1 Tax=Catharanthus roseus TaxID=4058 RepID=A0ACC0AXF0_CATRO|nr:hypothetical protein M9H77_24460 [Catharanthus roseus]
MYRSYYDHNQNNQYGWITTTSHEYVEHITRMERMPSMITDVPRFPNVYKAFSSQVPNHQAIYEIKYDNHLPRVNHQKHQPPAPETRKNVHFIDLEKRTTEVDRKGKSEVHKDFDVNQAADRFINQNRKKFERSTLKSI